MIEIFLDILLVKPYLRSCLRCLHVKRLLENL